MRSRRRIAALAACCLALAQPGCASKYAVLISTNQVTADNTSYHSEWWYDLVLQYAMLKDNGFSDGNIHVLYGGGSDFNTAHADYDATARFGHAITDMAVSKANVQAVFSSLSGTVTGKDHLYVWWMGHGGGAGPGSCDLTLEISNTGEHVTDAEFLGYLASVPNYAKRTVAVMTCHSGGMRDDLSAAGNRTVTLTSSTCAQSSYSINSTCNARPHAEFNYTEPNALELRNPCGAAVASDANGDSLVSFAEVHQYNSAAMATSSPQLADPDGIAAATHLKQGAP